MTSLILLGLFLVIFYWVDTPNRNIKEATERYRIEGINKDTRMTYKSLANLNNDLKTARNMIRLGLVKKGPDSVIENAIKNAYAGVMPYKNGFTTPIIQNLGLIKSSHKYVGAYPGDPRRTMPPPNNARMHPPKEEDKNIRYRIIEHTNRGKNQRVHTSNLLTHYIAAEIERELFINTPPDPEYEATMGPLGATIPRMLNYSVEEYSL